MKQKDNKKGGFSLIEVLFAVLFLSLIVFGVIRLQTSHLVLDNTQKNYLKAHYYVNQGLEILSAFSPELLANCSEICFLKEVSDDYLLNGAPPEMLESGLFERSIHKNSDGFSAGASLYTVKVKWMDSTGEHEVSGKKIVF